MRGSSVRVIFTDFPIYSTASDGKSIAVSGGGGGAAYGVPDVMELYGATEEDLCRSMHTSPVFLGSADKRQTVRLSKMAFKLIDSNPLGLVDSLVYSKALKLWIGGRKRELVFIEENSEKHLSVVESFSILPAPIDIANKSHLILDHVAVSSDGIFVAASGEDSIVRLFRLAPSTNLSLVAQFEHELASSTITDVQFSHDDKLIFVCTKKCKIFVFSLSGLLTSLAVCPKSFAKNISSEVVCRHVRSVDIKGSSHLLVTCHHPKKGSYLLKYLIDVKEAETSTWSLVATYNDKSSKMFNCMAVNNQRTLVGIGTNPSISVISISSFRPVLYAKRGGDAGDADMPATSAAFIDDLEVLAIGAGDFTLSLVDISAAAIKQSQSCRPSEYFSSLIFILPLLFFLLVRPGIVNMEGLWRRIAGVF